MGYWSDAAESEGGPKSPPGWHFYQVTRAMRVTKGGREFRSKNGDPQLFVIFEDEDGLEASQMFTLSAKAGWTLAKFLSRAGVDLAALDSEGIAIDDWASETFARERLEGLGAWAFCEHEQSGERTYTNLAFAHLDEVPADVLEKRKERVAASEKLAAALDDSDIPF